MGDKIRNTTQQLDKLFTKVDDRSILFSYQDKNLSFRANYKVGLSPQLNILLLMLELPIDINDIPAREVKTIKEELPNYKIFQVIDIGILLDIIYNDLPNNENFKENRHINNKALEDAIRNINNKFKINFGFEFFIYKARSIKISPRIPKLEIIMMRQNKL